jgi:hypothetical protein
MSTELEFIEALKNLSPLVEEPKDYRLHYDETGTIIMCSMQKHPENTQYIVVNKEIYDNYFRYYVQDSKLKLIDNDMGFRVQLKSSTQGYRVVKDHAGIILDDCEEYHDVGYYESN